MDKDNEFALQQVNEMCGAQALFLAAKATGKSITYAEITKILGQPKNGFSIAKIEKGAAQIGMSTALGRMPIRDFLAKGNTAILRLPQKNNNNTGFHYFVLSKIDTNSFLLFNPPFSVSSYTILSGPSQSYEGISVEPYRPEGNVLTSSWFILLFLSISIIIAALISSHKKMGANRAQSTV